MTVKNKNILHVVLALLIVALLVVLYEIVFNSWNGHDAMFHMGRIDGICHEINNNGLSLFPYRIYTSSLGGLSYGTPLFYPDVFLYPFAMLQWLGLSNYTCFRLLLIVIVVCSFASMWFVAKRLTGNNRVALESGAIYVLSPYLLYDILTRTAVGESLVFVFLPFAILGYYEIVYRLNARGIAFLTLGMCGIVLSHVISTVIVVLCLLAYSVFALYRCSLKKIEWLAISAICTCGITAFFTFPMIEQILNGSFFFSACENDIAHSCVPLSALLLPDMARYLMYKYLFGIVLQDNYPDCFGLTILLCLFAYSRYCMVMSKQEKILLAGIIVLFLLNYCVLLEPVANLFSSIQFVWRLMGVSTVLITLLLALLMKKKHLRIGRTFFLVSYTVIAMACMGSHSLRCHFAQKASYANITDKYKMQMGGGEYLPVNVRTLFSNNCDELLDLLYLDNQQKTHVLYYKGYEMPDGKPVTVENNNGVELVTNNAVYRGTHIQTISEYISAISIMLCMMTAFIVYISSHRSRCKSHAQEHSHAFCPKD